MTLNEFRAWFDGFSEAIGDAPTPEQWAKIKAKLAQAREPVVVPSVWPGRLPDAPQRYWGQVPNTCTTAGDPNAGRPITVSGVAAPARN